DNSSVLQVAQAAPPPSEDSDPNVLTNDKIAKMATFKLGDTVILGKIKTSQCSFDTSPDALIKLKQAGVSDAVLQAMIDTAAAPKRRLPVLLRRWMHLLPRRLRQHSPSSIDTSLWWVLAPTPSTTAQGTLRFPPMGR